MKESVVYLVLKHNIINRIAGIPMLRVSLGQLEILENVGVSFESKDGTLVENMDNIRPLYW